MPTNTKQILNAFLTLKPNKSWCFDNVSRSKTNAYTHSYHRYPAKFIPQIVDKLISKYTESDSLVLDPFGGCGTTLVEAKLLGRNSVGVDVNPVAKLITQVKVTPIKPEILKREAERVFLELENYSPKNNRNRSHRHGRLEYWFDKEVVQELDYIYYVIKRAKNEKVRKLLLVAFSHNLKNSSKWLMKSIKPTIDKEKKPQSSRKTFSRHLKSMVRKNAQYFDRLEEKGYLDVPAKMYRNDSTKNLPVKNNSVDLIVTSPPYVTSYEYADLHQLTLLWFGDDPDFKRWSKYLNEFSDFRRKFVGTKHKNKNSTEFNSLIAEDIVSDLKTQKGSLYVSVGNYFADMNLAFSEMHKVLKKGGHACIVIGNTSLKSVDILNAEVAAEQMLRIGFNKVKFIKREAANNKAIAPWRDARTGKFTNCSNKNKKMAYQYEFVIIMKKI